MTEWHVRYGGRGVMIYWHVEKKSACIYSQLKSCSSSEVAAMIEGRPAPLHRDERREELRRQPRPERGGLRLLPPARLPASAAAQRYPQPEALSARDRQARCLSEPAAGPDPPDQLGR